jgi:hypothetical protein
MKPADVQKFLRRNRHKLVRLFHLEHTDFDLRCAEIPGNEAIDGAMADDCRYQYVTIIIDAAKIKNEKHLWQVVKHEFLHTLLRPTEQLETLLCNSLEDHRSLIEAAFEIAKEQTVFNLERFEPVKRLQPPAK